MSEKVTAEHVADYLLNFFGLYEKWRKQNGLSGSIADPFEIFTSMTDKNGRIGRHIKHQERNDPKEDWPVGMAESLMGYIVYSNMLLKNYDFDIEDKDIRQGFINELNKAIKQHKE
jgi:hypothetical protein